MIDHRKSMTWKTSLPQAAGRTRKTLFVVACVYVGIGFFVAVPAALMGDPVSAFLGFMIISGALAGAVGLDAVLRLRVQLSVMCEAVDDIRKRLRRIGLRDLPPDVVGTGGDDTQSTALIDLAALAKGDPSLLTAATLDRSGFPRLAASVEETSVPGNFEPAGADEPSGVAVDTVIQEKSRVGQEVPRSEIAADQATRNLLQTWRAALRDGDLRTCRSVFSSLVDIVDTQRLAQLSPLLQDLTDRTERSLRKAFTDCVARRDFAAALRAGERICTLLPNHRIAADFGRLKPRLERRLREQPATSSPHAAVVR